MIFVAQVLGSGRVTDLGNFVELQETLDRQSDRGRPGTWENGGDRVGMGGGGMRENGGRIMRGFSEVRKKGMKAS